MWWTPSESRRPGCSPPGQYRVTHTDYSTAIMENMSTEKTWCLLMVFGPPRPPYLVVSEEDGGADGVEEDAVRTPAELVAERIV